MSRPLHLFEAFGIELEYMIVDRDTLEVKPIADELLKAMTGTYSGDFENGMITWSNELVLHLIELKCTKPEHDLDELEKAFHINIKQVNKELERWNAMLLPSAAHPSMNPALHAKLWPHDKNEIYEIYNKIFDCKGHGWSNLQSTHLNLPFSGDDEFGRLHAAIRVILPLLPALCASSTVLDGKITDHLDARMWYYKDNQKQIPSITGRVIPEPVFSEADYDKHIYRQIARDIAPFNEDGILDPVWVNSRGAMARFDRGSIEIRVMDIQECPQADIAIQSFVIQLLKSLVDEQWCTYEQQKEIDTEILASILNDTMKRGLSGRIDHTKWLALFDFKKSARAYDVLLKISSQLSRAGTPSWKPILTIFEEGNLSNRIRRSLRKKGFSGNSIADTWRQLATCLDTNTLFIPR